VVGWVAERARVTLGLSLRYGAGYAGIAVVTQTVLVWLAYFYAPPVETGMAALVPIRWVGIAVLVGRIVDAVSDPLVGAWSDATRNRLGRRRPFLIYGAWPLAATFVALWFPPPGLGPLATTLYLGLMVSLFLFFFTVYTAPYLALLPELARTRAERVGLATWQAAFQIAGLTVAVVGSGPLIERYGFGGMGVALGVMSLASFLVTAWGVPEPPGEHPPTPGLVSSVLLTLRNRPFVHYVTCQVLAWIGFNAGIIGVPYSVTVLMGGTEADASVALAIAFAVAVAAFPLLGLISQRRGLKWTLQAALLVLAFALSLSGLVGRLPVPLTPFAQGLVAYVLAGAGTAGMFVIPNAMMAEIADFDQRLHGTRREAMFFGVQGLLTKAAMGLSSYGATWLLQTGGFSVERPWGLVALGPAAAVCILLGVAALAGYDEEAVRGPAARATAGGQSHTTPPASSRM